MKRMNYLKIATGAIFMALSFNMEARESVSVKRKSVVAAEKTNARDCDPGLVQIDMDINNVRTKLLNTGDMWWDRNSAKYQVPKISKAQLANGEKGPNSLFSGAIWVSGKDQGGNLKIAAITFSGSESEYWPGPLVSGNLEAINKKTCKDWDQFFNVFGKDIDKVVGLYKKNGAVAESEVPDGVKYWPGRKNDFLSRDKGLDVEEAMAPFFDRDNDGIYDPTKGDFPAIKRGEEAYADQMVFWVLNDYGNNHTATQGQPLGIQMNCLAFAFASSNELNDMTFYRYHIVNKSSSDVTQTYMSQFVDCDLGNYSDDYIGCDVSRSMGYVYNGDAFDENSGSAIGYGTQVPIQGVDFFEGPIGDDGKQLGLTSFSYFINQAGSNLSDPQVAVEFRNVQTGFTRTGKPFTYGGDGISTTVPTKYCFPDYPNNASGWSMCSANLPVQDVRFVQNSGPFTMKTGGDAYITIGAVFVQPPVGSYNGCKIDVDGFLGKADDLAQNLFDNNFKVAKGPNAPELVVREMDKKLILNLVNPVTSNNYQEAYAEPSPDIPKEAIDNKYKFEGYMVYQLISPTVTSSELDDPSKAKLLLQCDIKNDIKDITNESFVEVDGVKVPIQLLKVKGSNTGIVHSIEINEDLFQTLGVKNLVNNKEYYFAAIAYSSNYYNITKTQQVVTMVKDTLGIDRPVRTTVTTTDKQKRPYLAGSNLYVASAIPHMSDVNGVEYKAKFGQGIPVTRVLGKGNGGMELDLLDSTYSMFFDKDNPLKNLVDNLEYKGGASPVKVRVTDPRSLQDVDFELQVVDSSYFTTKQQVSKKSSWFLLDKTNNDTLFGERNLSRPNEQIMYSQKTGKKYGISVEVGTIDSTGVNPVNKKNLYGFLNATLEFKDNFKKWLTFLKDEDGSTYKDWIKGGATLITKAGSNQRNNPHFTDIIDPNGSGRIPIFHDRNSEYSKMLEGKIAPYCLAANGLYDAAAQDEKYISYGPAFRQNTNNLTETTVLAEGTVNGSKSPINTMDELQSVDIVFTNDRTKWTRCIVMETGEDFAVNINGAKKGNLRSSLSTDLVDLANDNDGNKDGFKLTDIETEIGRGWFPGFAVNVETGQRLNMMFGENSKTVGDYAANMIWDPSSTELAKFGEPIFGGMQYLYVLSTPYDEGRVYRDSLYEEFNKYNAGNTIKPVFRNFYKTIMYAAVPMVDPKFDIYKRKVPGDKSSEIIGYELPSEARIRIRVRNPLLQFPTANAASYPDSHLVYTFSTKGLAPKLNDSTLKTNAMAKINAVPNPYYAFSDYEVNQLSNVVKITNLPDKCTVTIFDINGALVRRFNKDIDPKTIVSDGQSIETQTDNLDNAIKWDLKNHKGVPIASGLYYIHINAPGVGERTIKFFGALRPTDVTNF